MSYYISDGRGMSDPNYGVTNPAPHTHVHHWRDEDRDKLKTAVALLAALVESLALEEEKPMVPVKKPEPATTPITNGAGPIFAEPA